MRYSNENYEWVVPIIEQKQLDTYGEHYWDDLRRNCDQVGLICYA